jgi:predicted nucleotidyltransferase
MLACRLNEKEVATICSSVRRLDRTCRVYLYGSRVDLSAKGGDIDLLVVSEVLGFGDKLEILSDLKTILGDQKIDVTVLTPRQLAQDLFFQEVKKIELTA